VSEDPTIEARPPTIHVEGPVAFHDMACAVCHEKHAVYNVNNGLFSPCWDCQAEGWFLGRADGIVSRLLRELTEGGKP
jgi:hypothetical protein